LIHFDAVAALMKAYFVGQEDATELMFDD